MTSSAPSTWRHQSGDGPVTVLVVDDDVSLRRLIAFAMRRRGWETLQAGDSAEAIALLHCDAPPRVDAALIDGLLPDMHGLDLAARVVDDARTSRLPICFISGSLIARAPMSAGVGGIVKPATMEDIAAMVEELLRWRDQADDDRPARHAALRRLRAMLPA